MEGRPSGRFRLDSMLDYLISRLYILPAIIVGLSFHEWAHAFAAYKMGDPTARNLGRMTINPLAHIDPIGFIMMMIVGFGWAKPVPVNSNNFRKYRLGEIVVSLAGVTMNFIIALVFSFVFAGIYKYAGAEFLMSGVGASVLEVVMYFILVNLCLLVFNLIPIYPLDGFHVAETLLSKPLGPKPFLFIRKYGQYILIAIMLFGRTGFSPISYLANLIMTKLIGLAFMLFGVA